MIPMSEILLWKTPQEELPYEGEMVLAAWPDETMEVVRYDHDDAYWLSDNTHEALGGEPEYWCCLPSFPS